MSDPNSNPDIELKQCTKCKQRHPPTTEYFHRDKNRRDGLFPWCKKCSLRNVKKYTQRTENKKRRKKYIEEYKKRPGIVEGIREYKLRYYHEHYADDPKYIEKRKQYQSQNKHRRNEARRKRYANYTDVREKQLNRNRKLRENPEYRRQQRMYQRERRKLRSVQRKERIYRHNRKARKQNLPNTLSVQEWEYALEYFHGCCAVCGRQLIDLFGYRTTSMDHWIPLSAPNCPGTIPENIIPLCIGVDGCNNSKRDLLPEYWLNWKFGKRKAKQILKRIQVYFDSLK